LETTKARVNVLKKEIGPHKKAQEVALKSGAAFDDGPVKALLAEKDRLEVRITKNEVVVDSIHNMLQEQLVLGVVHCFAFVSLSYTLKNRTNLATLWTPQYPSPLTKPITASRKPGAPTLASIVLRCTIRM
jgi:hypothetical protein